MTRTAALAAEANSTAMSREKQITVRITEGEFEAWSAAAESDRRTLADWIRIVVSDHLGAAKTKKRR